MQQQGRGKGSALRTGFAAATGDIIVTLDADGSMDPGEIPGYVGQLLAGADYVKGSRFLQGGGTTDITLLRKLGAKAFVYLTRLLFGGRGRGPEFRGRSHPRREQSQHLPGRLAGAEDDSL